MADFNGRRPPNYRRRSNGSRKKARASAAENLKRMKNVLPSPAEVPYDADNGEIVAILPFTFGTRKDVVHRYEVLQKRDTQTVVEDAEDTVNENPPLSLLEKEPGQENVVVDRSEEPTQVVEIYPPLQVQEGYGVAEVVILSEDEGKQQQGRQGGPNQETPMNDSKPIVDIGEAKIPEIKEGPKEEEIPIPKVKKECPKCHEPSMKLLRNVYFNKEAGTQHCVGIPTCMNFRCMFISSQLCRLPMPVLSRPTGPFESKMKDVSAEDIVNHPIFKEHVEYAQHYRQNPKQFLPVDTKPIFALGKLSDAHFEAVLRATFDGEIPHVPL